MLFALAFGRWERQPPEGFVSISSAGEMIPSFVLHERVLNAAIPIKDRECLVVCRSVDLQQQERDRRVSDTTIGHSHRTLVVCEVGVIPTNVFVASSSQRKAINHEAKFWW